MTYHNLSLTEIHFHETFAVSFINSDDDNAVANQFFAESEVFGVLSHQHIYFFSNNNTLLKLDMTCSNSKNAHGVPI